MHSKILVYDRYTVVCLLWWDLTLKRQEVHGCIRSSAATDALVLKHQAISIYGADDIFIRLDQLNHTEYFISKELHFERIAQF